MWGWIAGAALALCLQDPKTQEGREADVKVLFLTNCAACHGETGDGKGWTKLDRPARSFQDGGFSYGNTPEALFRTITVGIPGTQMPGFGTSLTEQERRALADHVITLGPEGVVVEPEDTILVVRDRPLIVRGHLPPIVEGAAAHPRGLLIGTTDGLTFEYRIDGVRLLGVRQGGFVERTDWVGRGGTPLEPLGEVVYLVPEGSVRSLFGSRSELAGTWVEGERAGITYRLKDRNGGVFATVRESPEAMATSVGSGFTRTLVVQAVQDGGVAVFNPPKSAYRSRPFVAGGRHWWLHERRDGFLELTGVRVGTAYTRKESGIHDFFVGPNRSVQIVVSTLIAPEWSDSIQARFVEELEAR